MEATKQRLADELPQQLRPQLQVVQGCHSQLQQLVGSNTARVVCFNLGYLPKGDKQVLGPATSTLGVNLLLARANSSHEMQPAASGGGPN